MGTMMPLAKVVVVANNDKNDYSSLPCPALPRPCFAHACFAYLRSFSALVTTESNQRVSQSQALDLNCLGLELPWIWLELPWSWLDMDLAFDSDLPCLGLET
jgi:hypothetical protein